jgi:hypothetical protein
VKVSFIGGRADGAFVDRVAESDEHVWVGNDPDNTENMKLYFNPPDDHSGSADYYELHRSWPSLRWYYVLGEVIESKIGGKMFPDAPMEASDAG